MRYATANRRGGQLLTEAADAAPERPIALLATAIPSASRSASRSTSYMRCQTALKTSSLGSFSPPRPTPVISDITGPLLESSRLDQEPSSIVRHTQDGARWLSISIACLDQDSRETAAALADTFACLLVVCVFADAACTSSESRIE